MIMVIKECRLKNNLFSIRLIKPHRNSIFQRKKIINLVNKNTMTLVKVGKIITRIQMRKTLFNIKTNQLTKLTLAPNINTLNFKVLIILTSPHT